MKIIFVSFYQIKENNDTGSPLRCYCGQDTGRIAFGITDLMYKPGLQLNSIAVLSLSQFISLLYLTGKNADVDPSLRSRESNKTMLATHLAQCLSYACCLCFCSSGSIIYYDNDDNFGFFFNVGLDPRALCMLDQHSTIDPQTLSPPLMLVF